MPVINEKPQSAQQKYLEVINEVKRVKNLSGYLGDNAEIFDNIAKCEFHPKKLSDKCRYGQV